MKILSCLLPLLIASSVEASYPSIAISTQWFSDPETTRKKITSVIGEFDNELRLIRDGLRETQATSDKAQRKVIETSLQSLDAILDRQDAGSTLGLQELVNLLYTQNSDESSQIIPNVGNSRAQIGLNYFIDRVFRERMMGAADAVGEEEMEAMLRFYASNPAQTSERSWETNNTMLFVFGERVLDTLAKKVPDRIDAFYKAVKDARRSAQNGPGPDEEAIPEDERPTAEQLRAYEASFTRLEILATKGALPKSNLPSQINSGQPSVVPPTVPKVQPATKRAPEAKPTTTTQNEEPSSSTPWSIIIMSAVAALGLLRFFLKKPK